MYIGRRRKMEDKHIISISPVSVSTAVTIGTKLIDKRKIGMLTGYYHEGDNLVPLVKWKNHTESVPIFEPIYVLNPEFKLLSKQKNQLYLNTEPNYLNLWFDEVLYDGEIGTIEKVENHSNIISFYPRRYHSNIMFVFYTDKEYPEQLMPIIPFKTYILNLEVEEKQKQNTTEEKMIQLNNEDLYVVQTNDEPYWYLSLNGWCIPFRENEPARKLNPLFVEHKVLKVYKYTNSLKESTIAEPLWIDKEYTEKINKKQKEKDEMRQKIKNAENELKAMRQQLANMEKE